MTIFYFVKNMYYNSRQIHPVIARTFHSKSEVVRIK